MHNNNVGEDDSSEELPLIKDVDRNRFNRINPNFSDDESGSWDINTVKPNNDLPIGKFNH